MDVVRAAGSKERPAVNEPLDPDDHFHSCCDVVDDEIKRLNGDNRALRMILKECKGWIIDLRRRLDRHNHADTCSRIEMLVQQIDDELKNV